MHRGVLDEHDGRHRGEERPARTDSVHAPDGIRVEVYGEPALSTPVAMNHIHFFPSDIPGIKAWYVKVFGANPGRRPCVACIANPKMTEVDDLPGVNLSFSPSPRS